MRNFGRQERYREPGEIQGTGRNLVSQERYRDHLEKSGEPEEIQVTRRDTGKQERYREPVVKQ